MRNYEVIYKGMQRRRLHYDKKRRHRKAFREGRRPWTGMTIPDFIQMEGSEGEACSDYNRILVEMPPRISLTGFLGFLKGKLSKMIHSIGRS